MHILYLCIRYAHTYKNRRKMEKIGKVLLYVRMGGRLVRVIVDASGKCVDL